MLNNIGIFLRTLICKYISIWYIASLSDRQIECSLIEMSGESVLEKCLFHLVSAFKLKMMK